MGNHMFVAVPHPAACDVIEDVIRGEGRLVRELVIERPAGDTVLVVAVRPLRKAGLEDGETEGAIAVVRDVTELRRLERARQDFFGNVSHELKTPVTAIRGAVETVLDDPEMAPDVRHRFLDGARRNAVRLGSLVTDLLALARLEADPGGLRIAPVDVALLVTDVLAGAETLAAPREVVLELVVGSVDGAPSFTIEADEEALRQALDNLVDNAVVHSEPGAKVRVVLAQVGDALEVVVQDTGTGIPADALERVFERFYRVDAARSRARGGTGIGLSIVKHVAQAHGGSVSVESTIGEGSSFKLLIPVSPAATRGTHTTE
jgi:two-component system phosphate regulon sensor histidine kinase PhoR